MEVAKGLGRLREKLQEAHALHDRKERGEGTSVGSDQNFSVPSAPVARQTHADASAINQQPPSEPKDGRNGGGSDPQQAGTKSSHQQPVQAKRPGPEEKPCSVYEKTRSTISTVILPPERADDGEALARATDYGQSDGARFDLMIVAPTGEVTPDPRVWKKNGLERSAIYHASVQASLKAIAVEQQRYFDHLQSLLYIHVDSATRRAGDKAILYALPEDERKAAERWTGGSKWKDLLQQLKAYQERQERELSKRRERFQQLNRQLPMEPDQS